ncbi:hypothetical protein EJ05DRAFT_539918 [Pseudovirgaria hyperparasitica]|uniref:DUF1996 domain-containing protein n=1 Tax=Pseudovirgaria hyperparasitica TaxID=470096 RepID=A0A6A6W3E9_9PEZI|nr:uncharacterized protein EJ05DRAFT_539918 [Pseudovirgaria hyperparasitica]KAF2756117.1 hypothetical protein EJ05DRAFT_539918 [Pseudovirgaria hyperparasitica]
MRRSFKATLIAALAITCNAGFTCNGRYFAFYNRDGNALSYQQIDPALSPGTKSSHLHSFDGGNALAASMDYNVTQESTCTTNKIRPDLSNYWRPTLFWNGNNTGFYRVPEMFSKIYYKFGDDDRKFAGVSEFPEGFMMIAGNAMLRREPGVARTKPNPAVNWACLGPPGKKRIDRPGFPTGFTSCSEGFTGEIHFPTCWNGSPLDPNNPHAHMSYAIGSGTGIDVCPPGFQVKRFPEIFIEFWYNISSFDGHYSATDSPWVLSNGDPTGYSFHADFINGWQPGVLAKAMGTANASSSYCDCGCGCDDQKFQRDSCFGAMGINTNKDDYLNCAPKAIAVPGDDGAVLEKLPGCNPIQSGPADATMPVGEACNAVPAPTASDPPPPPSVVVMSPEPTSVVESGAVPTSAVVDMPSPPVETPSSVVDMPSLPIETPSSAAIDIPVPAPQPSALDPIIPDPSALPVIPIPSTINPVPAPGPEAIPPVPVLPSPIPPVQPTVIIPPVEKANLAQYQYQRECDAVAAVTITTTELVTLTVIPGRRTPVPTIEAQACGADGTVWRTVQEVVTVTVAAGERNVRRGRRRGMRYRSDRSNLTLICSNYCMMKLPLP